MKQIAKLSLAVACCLLLSAGVSSQPKPRWVQKGVRSLNRERTNDSYGFQAFSTFGEDINLLKAERFKPLMEYVGGEYGVAPESMSLDSLDGGERTTYRISFPDGAGTAVVYAQLVDDWARLSDDVTTWGFEMYQLYAVSKRDAAPEFDTFGLTERYPARAAFMSIVPGMGQVYKGESGKGYAIMGAEALLVGGIIYGELERARYVRLGRGSFAQDSYDAKATTFRQLRNVCIVAGGALYLYNLIDAAASKGARRVVISRPGGSTTQIAFTPVVTPCGLGAGVNIRF